MWEQGGLRGAGYQLSKTPTNSTFKAKGRACLHSGDLWEHQVITSSQFLEARCHTQSRLPSSSLYPLVSTHPAPTVNQFAKIGACGPSSPSLPPRGAGERGGGRRRPHRPCQDAPVGLAAHCGPALAHGALLLPHQAVPLRAGQGHHPPLLHAIRH
eukprot:8885456-Pyramimonas_sp.AAC.1